MLCVVGACVVCVLVTPLMCFIHLCVWLCVFVFGGEMLCVKIDLCFVVLIKVLVDVCVDCYHSSCLIPF